MTQKNDKPLTLGDFSDWATATNQTFNTMDETMNNHTSILNEHTRLLHEHTLRLEAIEDKLEPLQQIATDLKAIRENTSAMLSLYRRLDWRTEEMGRKINVDTREIDTRYPGPFPDNSQTAR